MPAPTITPAPDPPLRTEAPATFSNKAEAFVAWMADAPDEFNALATYLQGLESGTLDALLAALSAAGSSANKLPYYTGPNAVSLADLTTFARTILACANAAAVRTAIGAGDLVATNNLSDVANPSSALTNLGVSAFAKTLIDDADAAAMRATLGVPTAGFGSSFYEAGPPTPPTTVSLPTWDNQGTSTAVDGTGGAALNFTPQADGIMHGRIRAAPTAPYDIYCRLETNWLSTASTATSIAGSAGILLKDTASSNKRLGIGLFCQRNTSGGFFWAAALQRWSGASPPVFTATPIIKYGSQPWRWCRVKNDGTTLTFYVSQDGRNWITVGTETLAAHIGGVGSYGVFAITDASSNESTAIFTYFGTTAPS